MFSFEKTFSFICDVISNTVQERNNLVIVQNDPLCRKCRSSLKKMRDGRTRSSLTIRCTQFLFNCFSWCFRSIRCLNIFLHAHQWLLESIKRTWVQHLLLDLKATNLNPISAAISWFLLLRCRDTRTSRTIFVSSNSLMFLDIDAYIQNQTIHICTPQVHLSEYPPRIDHTLRCVRQLLPRQFVSHPECRK